MRESVSIATKRLPAQWEPHSCTYLSWPYHDTIWGVKHHDVIKEIATIAALIQHSEVLHIGVPNQLWRDQAAQAIDQAGGAAEEVCWHQVESNDLWARDHGPMIVNNELDSQPELVHWRFDGWGGQYPHESDDRISWTLNNAWRLPDGEPGFTLEGGAIDTNGCGDLLVTESVVLDPRRNAMVTKQSAERTLQTWLGVQRVHWLDGPLRGDDTGGHVDTLARFVSPETIVASRAPANHPDCKVLADNLRRLQHARLRGGRAPSVVEVPVPELVRAESGEILPASYLNFFITNTHCLIPAFGQPRRDELARSIIESSVGGPALSVMCRTLLTQFGGLHCVTRDLPASLDLWLKDQGLANALPW